VLRLLSIALFVGFPLLALSQAKIDGQKPIRIDYQSSALNKNPGLVESAAILIRDSDSKRVVRVQLEETSNNSGLFIGNYALTWGDQDVAAEVYLAPYDSTKAPEQVKKLEVLIRDGLLVRKPYFLRAGENNKSQILTVYDTKEQALEAFDNYRKIRTPLKSPVEHSALEAQKAAQREKERKARELVSAQLEAERRKLEIEEQQRQNQMRKNFDSLSLREQEKRKVSASQISTRAAKSFEKGQLADAESLYLKAAELDPSNPNHFLRYGVTLNRTEKNMRSLVILNLTEATGAEATERDFYTSLNYMKLGENDHALKKFKKLKESEDKTWSASAALYAGILEFQAENYDEAKKYFEYTLDHSTDPSTDKIAEAYIEQIANAMAFRSEQSKKFMITLTGGLIYDSNILSVSNSQLDQPTDLAGFRWNYGGSIEYRPVYTAQNDLSAILSISDLYSTDSGFKAQSNFQNTDPLLTSLYIPFKYKGRAFDRGYQMTLSPGYEVIIMNADGSDSRETILNSMALKNDHTLAMRDDWFSTYSLEYRTDKSLIDNTTTPEDDTSGTKISLSTSQTFFQNQKKTEAWIGELGLSQNSAVGNNATYSRYDLAATYMAPWVWDTTWTARLGYSNADYAKHTLGRADKNTAFMLGLRKPFSENFAGTLTGVYTVNQSTLEASDYRKYMIMTTFSWTTSL
jgi:hypothetical protein